MSLASTFNTSPVFVTLEPDWGSPVALLQKWRTDVTQSFDATEQRARRRNQPLWSINYVVAGLDPIAFSQRRAALVRELAAPIVIPIWTHMESLVSATTDVYTIGRPVATLPFKVGSFAFFKEPGLTSVFRRISALSGSDVTCESGLAFYPVGVVPTYTGACEIYPCVIGMHGEGAGFSEERWNSTAETIAVDEL